MSCIFCDRIILNKGAAKAHELRCLKNPHRISWLRSPKAGAQKGINSWAKGKKLGRHPLWDKKFPDSSVFISNSTYSRHAIKKRILEKNLIPYLCEICGIGPIWQGKPMPLILDHKNGINNDNNLTNLRFVCSNCDTQLPTYKSKNKKKVSAEVGSSNGLENRGSSKG